MGLGSTLLGSPSCVVLLKDDYCFLRLVQGERWGVGVVLGFSLIEHSNTL